MTTTLTNWTLLVSIVLVGGQQRRRATDDRNSYDRITFGIRAQRRDLNPGRISDSFGVKSDRSRSESEIEFRVAKSLNSGSLV